MSDIEVDVAQGPLEARGGSGLSRRALLKAGAVVGGGIWAAPVVESFVSKAAAESVPSAACYQIAGLFIVETNQASSSTGTTLYLKVVQAPNNSSLNPHNCLFAEAPPANVKPEVASIISGSAGLTLQASHIVTANDVNCPGHGGETVKGVFTNGIEVATATVFVPNGNSGSLSFEKRVVFPASSKTPKLKCSVLVSGDPSSPASASDGPNVVLGSKT